MTWIFEKPYIETTPNLEIDICYGTPSFDNVSDTTVRTIYIAFKDDFRASRDLLDMASDIERAVRDLNMDVESGSSYKLVKSFASSTSLTISNNYETEVKIPVVISKDGKGPMNMKIGSMVFTDSAGNKMVGRKQ